MFIKANDKIINADEIISIDCNFGDNCVSITIHIRDSSPEYVSDQQAVDIVMKLCPSALEGHRLKFIRHAWAIHNLIGHPGLQILSWLGLHKLGFKLHDSTVPQPVRRAK